MFSFNFLSDFCLTGAKYVEHCELEQVLIQNRRVYGIKTTLGIVNCEYFVNSAGMVGRLFMHIIFLSLIFMIILILCVLLFDNFSGHVT